MRLMQFSSLMVFLSLALAAGCGGGTRRDGPPTPPTGQAAPTAERRDGVVNGRVYYKGRDYGPLGLGDTPYRRALGDEIQELTHGRPLRQGFTEELFSFGRFYCYEKRGRAAGEATADVLQVAAGKFRASTRVPASTSEEVMLIDIAGTVADKTLCPDGYPNPIQSWP